MKKVVKGWNWIEIFEGEPFFRSVKRPFNTKKKYYGRTRTTKKTSEANTSGERI